MSGNCARLRIAATIRRIVLAAARGLSRAIWSRISSRCSLAGFVHRTRNPLLHLRLYLCLVVQLPAVCRGATLGQELLFTLETPQILRQRFVDYIRAITFHVPCDLVQRVAPLGAGAERDRNVVV